MKIAISLSSRERLERVYDSSFYGIYCASANEVKHPPLIALGQDSKSKYLIYGLLKHHVGQLPSNWIAKLQNSLLAKHQRILFTHFQKETWEVWKPKTLFLSAKCKLNAMTHHLAKKWVVTGPITGNYEREREKKNCAAWILHHNELFQSGFPKWEAKNYKGQ